VSFSQVCERKHGYLRVVESVANIRKSKITDKRAKNDRFQFGFYTMIRMGMFSRVTDIDMILLWAHRFDRKKERFLRVTNNHEIQPMSRMESNDD